MSLFSASGIPLDPKEFASFALDEKRNKVDEATRMLDTATEVEKLLFDATKALRRIPTGRFNSTEAAISLEFASAAAKDMREKAKAHKVEAGCTFRDMGILVAKRKRTSDNQEVFRCGKKSAASKTEHAKTFVARAQEYLENPTPKILARGDGTPEILAMAQASLQQAKDEQKDVDEWIAEAEEEVKVTDAAIQELARA
jgi:hypothetical protein